MSTEDILCPLTGFLRLLVYLETRVTCKSDKEVSSAPPLKHKVRDHLRVKCSCMQPLMVSWQVYKLYLLLVFVLILCLYINVLHFKIYYTVHVHM